MLMHNWEEVRHTYRPAVIKVLFIGESPPAGGTFFYNADSNLFKYTQAAFLNVRGNLPTGRGFLATFKELGFFLDDLCLVPVNNIENKTRAEKRSAGVPSLVQRLKKHSPEIIIVVMKAIQDHVRQAVQLSNLNSTRFFSLPFPAQGNQQRYVTGLSDVLAQLQKWRPDHIQGAI